MPVNKLYQLLVNIYDLKDKDYIEVVFYYTYIWNYYWIMITK